MTVRTGDRCGLRRGLICVGDIGGDGDRVGDLLCFRGVKGEPLENMYEDGGGGNGGYELIGMLLDVVAGGYGAVIPTELGAGW